ncbi:MAG: DUF1015 domain-containing protein [Eubacterium sp.]|nr:DUF1015 domain-containing protein [Eubacterium sp.]MDD7210252.1 DUF1015 domain-containing protein [Lachnospiraceae bacterium]MDY5497827.1 DUF1015 domain-containing protein [Anaerobutyricum sp.]
METAFYPADILLPKDTIDMEKWSVVACDQFTSEPEYWNQVREVVGEHPSTFSMILPEVFLGSEGEEKKLERISTSMCKYLEGGILREYKDSLIYVERTDSCGNIRAGLVGKIDLEQYDYKKSSRSLIRATEATVTERIPARVKIRENAVLEVPHIMLLIDDEEGNVIEPLAFQKKDMSCIYDYDLMLGGGHIKGYLLGEKEKKRVQSALEKFSEPEYFSRKYRVKEKPVLLFAVGDGNHSLAAAKEYYEKLKAQNPGKDFSHHPARYALVELVNLHSEALVFEAIHRIVTGVHPEDLLSKMEIALAIKEEGEGQTFYTLENGRKKKCVIGRPTSKLTVGSLQRFLDGYLAQNGGKIDYIHGELVVKQLSEEKDSIGFLLPDMKKEELFPTVIHDGALPRKTFSMGHAQDKRYYTECRIICDHSVLK